MHMKPASAVQAALHPSPSLALPSSHASGVSFMPSPHLDTQIPFVQSGSNEHDAEQPSPSTTLPSSQASVPSLLPSPHTVFLHVAGWLAFGLAGGGSHTKPGSTLQPAEHPLPALGGSHCSPAVRIASPQRASQGCPGCGQLHPPSS